MWPQIFPVASFFSQAGESQWGSVSQIAFSQLANWKSEPFAFTRHGKKQIGSLDHFAFCWPGKKQIGSLNHFAFSRPGKRQIGSLIHFQLLLPGPWKILCRGKLRKYGERFALRTRKTTGQTPLFLLEARAGHSSCRCTHSMPTSAGM